MVRILVLVTVLELITLVTSIRIDLGSGNGYSWEASLPNRSLVVPGRVPGGIYSDVNRFGVLDKGPLFFRFNDLHYRWISYEDWNYQLRFQVDASVLERAGVFLTFLGVDTSATVVLNGHTLGTTDNMFVRYRYSVKQFLRFGENVLDVLFKSSVTYAKEKFEEQLADYIVPPECVPDDYHGECHANHIRKMQASFAWDWGPAFPSLGIWRPVYLEAYDSLVIRDVIVETAPTNETWDVNLKVYAEAAGLENEYSGTWTVELFDRNGNSLYRRVQNRTLTSNDNWETETTFQFEIAKSIIEKWMPNGYGKPVLYKLRVACSHDGEDFSVEKRVGFRTVELVQEDLVEGGRSFYVEVNGEPAYLKGSNWIPAHVLPEMVTTEYLRDLLESARLANMNALRVWGGGIYELDEFYDIADELGILIWQDFMFACSMYPVNEPFLETVRVETRQQVRRLQSHPSVMLWAGNNENEAALRGNWYGTIGNFQKYRADYVKLYVETIRSIVEEEDWTRPFVMSSPSNGKRSEEEGYVAVNPYSDLHGDVHYYNYLANAWNWTTYPRPRMASEYGFQSLPSLHAWAEISDPIGQGDDWFFNGTLLAHRQHHPMGNLELGLQVNNRFGDPKTSSPEQKFLDMIYLTQMHQAEAIKVETEHYRRYRYLTAPDGSGRTMGALYWQLNDIWQAPSWASIEFGGRWKPLHYFAQKFFAPLVVLTVELENGPLASFLHFDRTEDFFPGYLSVKIYTWDNMEPVLEESIPVNELIQPEHPVWSSSLEDLFNATGCTRETCVVTTSYTNAENKLAPDNEYFLTSFPHVQNLRKANVQISSVSEIYPSDASPWTANITLASDCLAVFVWLDTVSDMNGRFSDNGFLLREPIKLVQFYSRIPLTDPEQLRMDLTVTHLAQIIL